MSRRGQPQREGAAARDKERMPRQDGAAPERRIVIAPLAVQLMDRYDVRWHGSLVVLTCLRCGHGLVFSAKMHLSAIAAGARRHEPHCRPGHAARA